jgi:hypothetical protein
MHLQRRIDSLEYCHFLQPRLSSSLPRHNAFADTKGIVITERLTAKNLQNELWILSQVTCLTDRNKIATVLHRKYENSDA